MIKNTISIILAIVICLNSVPISALAENTEADPMSASSIDETESVIAAETEVEESEESDAVQITEKEESDENSTDTSSAIDTEKEDVGIISQDGNVESEMDPEESEEELHLIESSESVSEANTEEEVIDASDQNERYENADNGIAEDDITESAVQEGESKEVKAANSTAFTYEIIDNSSISITGYSGSDTAVIIPETIDGYTVTEISSNVFIDCTKITEIKLPETLQKIGYCALEGCTGLTKLDVPDNVTSIEEYAFEGCTGLTALELPDGVTFIGGGALSGCENLQRVNYPRSLNSAGGEIFQGDSKLTRIEVPEGVTELPSYVFKNCTNFTEIKLPETLEKIGLCAMEGCTGLRSIYLPKNLNQIEGSAFYGCDRLTTLSIPEGIKNLEYETFANCANLGKVYLSDSIESIDSSAFDNSPNVVFYCAYFSYSTLYAIENNIPFVSTGTYIDSENSILDRSATAFYGDFNSMSANGYVSLTIRYGIKEAYRSEVSNMSIRIELPSGVDLDESTLKVDGTLCTDYEYDYERELSVPVTNPSGTIRFCVKILSQNTISGFAALNFYRAGNDSKEILGIINEDVPVFTIDVPERTSENRFNVSGAAPAASSIELQVGNNEKVTVSASKAGNWRAVLTIDEPKDYYEYKIKAVCTTPSGTQETRTASVIYVQGEPSINSLIINYNEHNVNKSYDLTKTDGILPVIYYLPGTEFVFEASFENPEKIDELYITSTRNNVTKYLPAKYDAQKGAFITSGYFDENDKNYVPGVISYEYNMRPPEVKVGTDYDLESYVDLLPAGAAEDVTVTTNTDTELRTSIDLSKFDESLKGVVIDTDISVVDAASGTDLGKWKDLLEEGDNVMSYVIPGYNDEKYICNLDYSDAGTWLMLVKDVSGNKYIKLSLDVMMEEADDLSKYAKLMEVSTTLSSVNSTASLLYSNYQIEKDMDELRNEVMSSGHYSSTEELNAALKKVDNYDLDQNKLLLATTVMTMLIAAPITAGAAMTAAPFILASALIGTVMASKPFFDEFRLADIKGEKYKSRFIVDPSGIVYDIDTGEFLEDVTTTAYWIEYDDSDDFWDNKPEDSEYGTVWDAEEYNQGNPLLTNVEGKYAWDVPEGWWRVKYEKEGYETAWSGWMTVPPIQTEVNIGLKSTAPKTVELDNSTEIDGVSNKIYTGKPIEQDITVNFGGKELAKDSDYTVEYADNINAGTATITINGIGSYTGTVAKTFMILPGKTTRGDMFNLANNVKVTWKEVPGAKYYKVYREGITNRSESRDEPVIITTGLVGWDKSPGLTNGNAYKYKIVASLTGKGDSSGDSPLSYSKVMYRLKTVVIRSVKNTAPRKVTVKYDKTTSGDSYVLQYCEREDMVGAKTKVVLGANNTSYTIGGLKKGKTYYISIRVRKKVNGIDYYTTFGVAKKITISK